MTRHMMHKTTQKGYIKNKNHQLREPSLLKIPIDPGVNIYVCVCTCVCARIVPGATTHLLAAAWQRNVAVIYPVYCYASFLIMFRYWIS